MLTYYVQLLSNVIFCHINSCVKTLIYKYETPDAFTFTLYFFF